MWKWLTTTTKDEILDLPLEITDLREMDLRPEAKTLIGFWLSVGVAHVNRPTPWMLKFGSRPPFWSDAIRLRIAESLAMISHWTIIHGEYYCAPDVESTWFIDPPYQIAGKAYRCGSCNVDFEALALWCLSRRGQVIACENVGASWLPFVPFSQEKSLKGTSAEAIWYCETGEP